MENTNVRKNIIINNKEQKRSRSGKRSTIGKVAHSVLDGTFLTRDGMIRQMPFLLYLAFLALVYITNSFYAERNVIETDRLRKEMKELRYKYITIKSQLMFISKQSEVLKKISLKGLKEATVPPYKVVEQKGNN
jgi:hypothetical protein